MIKQEVDKLLSQFQGWKLAGEAIEKNYRFDDFKQAIEFINRVAVVADAQNHHPDILLWNWNNVKITLTTHAVKGLSENDFVLAAKIDQINPK